MNPARSENISLVQKEGQYLEKTASIIDWNSSATGFSNQSTLQNLHSLIRTLQPLLVLFLEKVKSDIFFLFKNSYTLIIQSCDIF